jgi:hypothetical protein
MHKLAIVSTCIMQLSVPLFCQILQNHPELCGNRMQIAEVPPALWLQ